MIQKHSIPPFYNEDSEILILGSFPSERSRAEGFFYAHPSNRFWDVLRAVFEYSEPLRDIEDKKRILSEFKIALWDVVGECEIEKSADSTIRSVCANDVSSLIVKTRIKAVFTNGKAADKLYRRHLQPELGISAVNLPSTSAANASCSLSRLVSLWSVIKG